MVVDCARCPLRKHSIFDSMATADVAFMQKFKVGELKVDKGTPLLMEGSSAPQLYTALSGLGLRYKLLPEGQRQIVGFVLPGDFIGLQAGVMGAMEHSVESSTAMTLCVFDRAALWTLFQNHPQRAYDLVWLASVEEGLLGEALASVGQLTAEEKICWALVRFFHRCENLDLVDGGACPFPYRQQDLADALGLSLVHTNKTLMALRDKQILSWSDSQLRLLNQDAAEKLGHLPQTNDRLRPLI